MSNDQPAIQHISDTARWAAVYRAIEDGSGRMGCFAILMRGGWPVSGARRLRRR